MGLGQPTRQFRIVGGELGSVHYVKNEKEVEGTD